MNGDTGGVNLGERQVSQVGTFLKRLNGSRAVTAHGVSAQEERTAITAGCKNNGMGGITLQLTGDEVAHDHTACAAVDHHDVKHLAAVIALNSTFFNLAVQRCICTQQQLLAGLTFGIERTAHLGAAE